MKQQASVLFDPRFNRGPIDERIFSGFLEHLGRAIYAGVYEPGHPNSDDAGMRTDVIDALKPMRMPAVRYPGGNFVSNYDWKDGIGAVDQRPKRADFAWRTIEPNTFGTDEFIEWCRRLGTDPMLAVNLGTGTPKSAAELVEYCNLPTGTSWAEKRAANGNSDPHSVPVWCLGNEMDGPWQAGHVPADEYALRAQQAGRLMKGIDPGIELVLAGSSGRQMATYMEWDRTILEYCWDTVDYVSAHRYSRNYGDDTQWFLAEGVEIERIIQDYRALLGYVKALNRSDRDVYLSFDEWNVWYKNMIRDGEWTVGPALVEEIYNLEDALVVAQYLNAFIRNADIVKIACLAQIVNVIAPVLTSDDGVLRQATYWPFVNLAQAVSGVSLAPALDCPVYAAGERGETPVLDVAGSYDELEGRLAVSLVNRSLADEVSITIAVADMNIAAGAVANIVSGGDPKAHNTWDAPETIVSVESQMDAGGGAVEVELPPLSHTVLQFAVRPAR